MLMRYVYYVKRKIEGIELRIQRDTLKKALLKLMLVKKALLKLMIQWNTMMLVKKALLKLMMQ